MSTENTSARDAVVALLDPWVQRAFRRPVVFMVVIGVIAVLLCVVHVWPAARRPVESRTAPMVAVPTRVTPRTPQDAVVQVVVLYNQASMRAGATGQLGDLVGLLDPAGTTLPAVQTEFQRRAQAAETHEATLTQWRILQVRVHDTTAIVDTQEQWNDVVRHDGAVVRSDRGMLSRATYTLRASAPGTWLITDVQSQIVVQ